MGKRKELSFKEKVQLINKSEGKSHRKLSEQFGVGKQDELFPVKIKQVSL